MYHGSIHLTCEWCCFANAVFISQVLAAACLKMMACDRWISKLNICFHVFSTQWQCVWVLILIDRRDIGDGPSDRLRVSFTCYPAVTGWSFDDIGYLLGRPLGFKALETRHSLSVYATMLIGRRAATRCRCQSSCVSSAVFWCTWVLLCLLQIRGTIWALRTGPHCLSTSRLVFLCALIWMQLLVSSAIRASPLRFLRRARVATLMR